MVRLTIKGDMTEGYFTAYAGVCVAPIIAKLFSTTSPPAPPTAPAVPATPVPTA
jgi:hypothetical protein